MSSPAATEFMGPASEMAREAGALLLEFARKGVETEYKGEADLVTAADRASEKLIVGRLRKEFPKHDIFGEEGTRDVTGSDYRWHIDPLDGTTNFAHGYPAYCVSMGLERHVSGTGADWEGELVAGVIYDPTRDELYAAEKGSGAFLNGKRMHVSKTPRVKDSLLATGFPSQKRHKNPNIYFYHQLSLRSHGVRRAGSAALDLACVASGKFDGFWEFNLNAWDTAAGVILVREAGGKVSQFRGEPFHISSKEVMASNGLLHEALLEEFATIFSGAGLEEISDPRQYAETRQF